MTQEEFYKHIYSKDNTNDYGMILPPVTAKEGIDIIINHFLGEDWHTVIPMSREQIIAVAIYEILGKYKIKEPLLKRIKKYFQNKWSDNAK